MSGSIPKDVSEMGSLAERVSELDRKLMFEL